MPLLLLQTNAIVTFLNGSDNKLNFKNYGGRKKFFKGFVVIFIFCNKPNESGKSVEVFALGTKPTLESTNLSAQVVFSAYIVCPVSIPFGHPEIMYGKIQTLSKVYLAAKESETHMEIFKDLYHVNMKLI